mgnify:CR=1 FL=1
MVCYAMLCYAILSYAMLCYAMQVLIQQMKKQVQGVRRRFIVAELQPVDNPRPDPEGADVVRPPRSAPREPSAQLSSRPPLMPPAGA